MLTRITIPSGTKIDREISHAEEALRLLFLREYRRNLYHGRAQIGLNNRQTLQYDREIREATHAIKKLDPDNIFRP
jgi:hypothetical protein